LSDIKGANITEAEIIGADITKQVQNSITEELATSSQTGNISSAVGQINGGQISARKITEGYMTRSIVTGGKIEGNKITGANITNTDINQADVTGPDVTGAKITTGSEAGKESRLSKVHIIDETLEKVNPFK
jgi:uncharacterized protein YjbI with pentapeptide repeats